MIKKTKILGWLAIMAFVVLATTVQAELLVHYDPPAATHNASTLPPTVVDNNVVASDISRVGITGGNNAGAQWPLRFYAVAFDAAEYLSLTIEPETDRKIVLESLEATFLSWSGAFNVSIRTSLDGFAGNAGGNWDLSTTGGSAVTFDLTSLDGQAGPIEIRFHIWESDGSNSWHDLDGNGNGLKILGTTVPADQAALVSPPNGGLGIPVQTLLEWAPSPSHTVDRYGVYFGTDPNELSPTYDMETPVYTGTAVEFDPDKPGTTEPDLEFDTPYFWRVDYYEPNGLEETLWVGETWSFTTVVPIPIIATQPVSETAASVDLSIVVTNGALYEWYQVGNPVAVQTTGDLATPLGADTYTTAIEGFYYCVATNGAGTVTSDTVRVMTPRLVAHLALDGTLDDSSAAGIWDGVYVDPNEPRDVPATAVDYVAGADGTDFSAVQFNGTSIIEIPDSNEFFDFAAQGYTLTAWVKGTGGYRAIRKLPVEIDLNTANGLWVKVGTWQQATTAPEGIEDEWHFIAVTYDPGTGQQTAYGIYDDDDVIPVLHTQLKNSVTVGSDTTSNMTIGGPNATNPAANNYAGAIDDVQVYNYALTEAEIIAVYGALTDAPLCLTLDDPDIAPFDHNNDCQVTLADFAAYAEAWLNTQVVDIP